MKTGAVVETQAAAAAKRPRALILEDSHDNFELLTRQLKRSEFQIVHTRVDNERDFREALRTEEFDVILSDCRVPTWNGLQALGELRKTGQDIPFLLITETLGEEAAVEGMKQGVTEYILKEHLSRLPRALERALAEKKLRDDHDNEQQE